MADRNHPVLDQNDLTPLFIMEKRGKVKVYIYLFIYFSYLNWYLSSKNLRRFYRPRSRFNARSAREWLLALRRRFGKKVRDTQIVSAAGFVQITYEGISVPCGRSPCCVIESGDLESHGHCPLQWIWTVINRLFRFFLDNHGQHFLISARNLAVSLTSFVDELSGRNRPRFCQFWGWMK